MAEKRSHKPEFDRFAQTWRLPLARLLLVVAMGISAYLLYVSLSGGGVAGCGSDSGCDRVLKSPWAYWLGIPVSAPALLVYATLLGLTFQLKSATAERRRLLWRVAFTLALGIVGAAAWFIGLMLVAVKGVCPYCLVAHASGITVAILLLRSAPIRPVPEHPWQREKHLYLPPALARKLAFIALGAVAMLAVGQVLVKKPMNIVRTIPGATNLLFGGTNRLLSSTATMTNPVPATLERAATIPAPTNALTAQAPTNPAPVIPTPTPISPIPAPLPQAAYSTSKTPRLVTTHNGMFVYDLSQLPVLGSPSAANVVISLFDYTCHHCHTMHGQILEALQQLSNQVAIVNLPMPLDAECNPAIYRTHRTASNACNYARLGLAVWRAAPEQLAKFDAFMFSKMPQPPLAEANTFAANLVGADKLGRALMDPWVAEQLKRDVSIYQTNIAVLHNGAMPQLILGSKVSAGVLNSTADLIKLIRENQQ